MSKSNPRFDDEGRKLYTANSPLYAGTRSAGPPAANPPRWQSSLHASWARVEARDARRRIYDAARDRGEIITPEVARRRVLRELGKLPLPFIAAATITEAAAVTDRDSPASHADAAA